MRVHVRALLLLAASAPLAASLLNVLMAQRADMLAHPVQLLIVTALSAIPGTYPMLLAKLLNIPAADSPFSRDNVTSSLAVIVCGILLTAFVYFINLDVVFTVTSQSPGASTAGIAYVFLPIFGVPIAVIGALIGAAAGMAVRRKAPSENAVTTDDHR